jgi:hypothetical protein
MMKTLWKHSIITAKDAGIIYISFIVIAITFLRKILEALVLYRPSYTFDCFKSCDCFDFLVEYIHRAKIFWTDCIILFIMVGFFIYCWMLTVVIIILKNMCYCHSHFYAVVILRIRYLVTTALRSSGWNNELCMMKLVAVGFQYMLYLKLSGSPVTTVWHVLRLRMEETASRYGG